MIGITDAITNALKVKKGDVVADFGCGMGHHARVIAPLVGKEGKVYALDIQRSLLEHVEQEAQLGGLSITPMWADIDEERGSTLHDRSVDAVIIVNTLFQCEKKQAVFVEAARILKPAGKCLVIDWKDSFGGLGPHPDDVVTDAQARTLVQGTGLREVGVVPAGAYSWGILFEKQ